MPGRDTVTANESLASHMSFLLMTGQHASVNTSATQAAELKTQIVLLEEHLKNPTEEKSTSMPVGAHLMTLAPPGVPPRSLGHHVQKTS